MEERRLREGQGFVCFSSLERTALGGNTGGGKKGEIQNQSKKCFLQEPNH
jgi:hypothetical protein